jgi:histidinol phosphatase-like enzyme|tara:strand:+ start:104 stop:442 length:339 start_codon:yes stop_codon:yes gene_type:complete
MKNITKYCFDLDGVICKTKSNNYKKSKPIKDAINKINRLYLEGHYILIYTSRFMGRSNEKVSKANKMGYQLTLKQLKSWGVKFNKLKLGKPSYDIIIDDKSLNYSKDWVKKV